MIFVPIAQDAIDAEQFEVFLAESFYLLRWVELAAGAGWIFSFAHRLAELVVVDVQKTGFFLGERGCLADETARGWTDAVNIFN